MNERRDERTKDDIPAFFLDAKCLHRSAEHFVPSTLGFAFFILLLLSGLWLVRGHCIGWA
jgi:hypothetical protein